MSIVTDTGWSYENSSGIAAAGGEVVEVTAGQARVYVKSPDGTIYKIIGTGLGGGVGLSFLPVGLTASDISLLSTGSNIYGLGNSELTVDDLGCIMVIYSVSATILVGGVSGSLCTFINPTTYQKIMLGLGLSVFQLQLIPATALTSTKGVCVFCGTEYALSLAGADVLCTVYWVSSVDPL